MDTIPTNVTAERLQTAWRALTGIVAQQRLGASRFTLMANMQLCPMQAWMIDSRPWGSP